WFEGKAAQAKKDSPHAIVAASFQKTTAFFPLVWAPKRKDVFGEDVTERYVKKPELKKEQVEQIEKEAGAFFAASAEQQAKWEFDAKLDQLLMDNEQAVRRAVWKAYQGAPIHAALKKDFDDNQARYKEHVS